MKIYYKGVLFQNWKKAIKNNSREDKKKISDFRHACLYRKHFDMLKKNYTKNKKIEKKFNDFFKIYFGKLKKISFRTLKLETKYYQS